MLEQRDADGCSPEHMLKMTIPTFSLARITQAKPESCPTTPHRRIDSRNKTSFGLGAFSIMPPVRSQNFQSTPRVVSFGNLYTTKVRGLLILTVKTDSTRFWNNTKYN